MENLKIYGQDGKAVLERDLAEDKGPLMVLAGDVPRLVDVVEQGVEVIGALVRDEDGWVLASAKADADFQPVAFCQESSGVTKLCLIVVGVDV